MDPETKRSTAFLQKDISRICSEEYDSFSIAIPSDIYTWDVLIIGPPGTAYENGIYRAVVKFPKSYPEEPPTFVFKSKMFHPNIEVDGTVCISILHSGQDFTGYETDSDRWLPVRSPESVIMSVISLLDNPNCDSPANVDASKMYTSDKVMYEKMVRRLAQITLED